MKVILNQDIENLGEEGDICEVARGYARNYLIPRNMVLQYNDRNKAIIESRREAINARKEEKRKAAQSARERIESEELVLTMPAGRNKKLFGSVTAQTISSELEKWGIYVEKKRIEIPENTIKTIGNFKVGVKLYAEEEATLSVAVKPTADSEAAKIDPEAPAEPEAKAEAAEPAAEEQAVEEGVSEEAAEEEFVAEESAEEAVAAEETPADEADEEEEEVEEK
ncbi:MAG: 50S ribosomal protein L9 [Spirochaetaceae bacterium]